jgi:hypothetical protein
VGIFAVGVPCIFAGACAGAAAESTAEEAVAAGDDLAGVAAAEGVFPVVIFALGVFAVLATTSCLVASKIEIATRLMFK